MLSVCLVLVTADGQIVDKLHFNIFFILIFLKGNERAIPVLIIGILVFLPGFYHLRIAYYAAKGYRGYSYDDIPDFDD